MTSAESSSRDQGGWGSRRGTILPMALIVVIAVSCMILMASLRMLGLKNVQDVGAMRHQAIYAAEAVCAIHESALADLAAAGQRAALDQPPWTNHGTDWFGGCLVRWRLDPVRLTALDGSGSYTVNPLSTPSPTPPGAYVANPEYYVYRIAAEAYRLDDPTNMAGLTSATDPHAPWNDPTRRLARVQSQRDVVIDLAPLFKYAVFYAQSGPIGDLEFCCGDPLTISGAVHTNGALYLGGGSSDYTTGNYYAAASGLAPVSIGSAASMVPVVAVGGIYRSRKVCNVLSVRDPSQPVYQPALSSDTTTIPDPGTIPLPGVGGMTGNSNLNGDSSGGFSTVDTIDGQAISASDDSRTPTAMRSTFLGWVRDGQTGGRTVETVANIPTLAGRPFEPYPIVGDGAILYDRDGDPTTTDYTVDPTSASKPLFLDGSGNPTIVPTARPLYAGEMPEFLVGGQPDVWRDVTEPPLDTAGANATYLTRSDVEARGPYLQDSLVGTDGGTTTGLTIRERGQQNTGFFTGAKPVSTAAAYVGNPTAFVADSIRYLESQYAVFLAGTDVTGVFFSFNQTAAAAAGDLRLLPAAEDDFHNRRESRWLSDHGYLTPAAAATSTVDVLTLDIGHIQGFLTGTTIAGAVANTRFNGLIYVHRTPRWPDRSGSFDPLRPFGYHPIESPSPMAPAGFNAVPYYSPVGAAAIGAGPQTIPFSEGVRIVDAATIDYGITDPTAAHRRKGLTIVTPDQCYIWGDVNTTAAPDDTGAMKLPPCAVYADGVTVLSASWLDAQNQQDSDPIPPGVSTTLNLALITDNVPTTPVNAMNAGSGAFTNLLRLLENWSASGPPQVLAVNGSIVVLNQQRYSRGDLGAGIPTTFYGPAAHQFSFNPDLLVPGGEPAFSPQGVDILRAVSTVEVVE